MTPRLVCAWCDREKVRGQWVPVDPQATGLISHGICPACAAQLGGEAGIPETHQLNLAAEVSKEIGHRQPGRRLTNNPQWSTYAGGTGAAEGKHGYSARVAGGTYHVDPFTTKYGRHAGYLLRFTTEGGARLPVPGLWTGIAKDGTAVPIHMQVIFWSPNEAKGAAKKHAALYGTESATVVNENPAGETAKKARSGKWEVTIGQPEKDRGYFEHDIQGEGGGLWFEGKSLVDYDGRFELPRDVVVAIRSLGYTVGQDFIS